MDVLKPTAPTPQTAPDPNGAVADSPGERDFGETLDFDPHACMTDEEIAAELREAVAEIERGDVVPHEQVMREAFALIANERASGRR